MTNVPRSERKPLSVPLTMLCQFTRLMTAAWIGLNFVAVTRYWSNKQLIIDSYTLVAGHPIEPISTFQQVSAFATVLVSLLSGVVFVVMVWRLFGCYIAGYIFDSQAVSAFRAMANSAVPFFLLDLTARVIIYAIITNGELRFRWTDNDSLNGAFVLILLILARIFTVGAAMADENRQIV